MQSINHVSITQHPQLLFSRRRKRRGERNERHIHTYISPSTCVRGRKQKTTSQPPHVMLPRECILLIGNKQIPPPKEIHTPATYVDDAILCTRASPILIFQHCPTTYFRAISRASPTSISFENSHSSVQYVYKRSLTSWRSHAQQH